MNEHPYLKKMGGRMRKIRMSQNISIKKMHRIMGLAESTITTIEKGRSDVHLITLKQIADLLKVDVKEFL